MYSKENMKSVTINNGIVVFPDDFWYLIWDKASESNFAGVVATREEGVAPHFIFTSVKPIHELTEAEVDLILSRCCEVSADLAETIALSAKEAVGVFALEDAGNDNTTYPFGAMIVRGGDAT